MLTAAKSEEPYFHYTVKEATKKTANTERSLTKIYIKSSNRAKL